MSWILGEDHSTSSSDASLLDVIESWAAYVVTLHSQRATTLEELPTAWGMHDLIGGLYARTWLETELDKRKTGEGYRRLAVVEAADELFRSFTRKRVDARALYERAQPGTSSEPGWWWERVPNSGPALEELNTLGGPHGIKSVDGA